MTSARERLSRRFAHRKTRESRTPTKETLQHPSSSLLGRLQIELESDVRQFSGWQWTPSTGTQQRAIASPTDAQAELQLTYYLEGLNRSSKSGPAHLVAEASMVLTDSQGKVLMQERSSHRSNSFTDMRAGNIIMNAQAEKMFREVGTQAATHHRQNLQKFFNKN